MSFVRRDAFMADAVGLSTRVQQQLQLIVQGALSEVPEAQRQQAERTGTMPDPVALIARLRHPRVAENWNDARELEAVVIPSGQPNPIELSYFIPSAEPVRLDQTRLDFDVTGDVEWLRFAPSKSIGQRPEAEVVNQDLRLFVLLSPESTPPQVRAVYAKAAQRLQDRIQMLNSEITATAQALLPDMIRAEAVREGRRRAGQP